MNVRRVLCVPVFCLLFVAALGGGKSAPEAVVDIAELDLRDGDIVFQHLPGKLCSVICDVTDSQMSHCGMVVHRKGEPQVIEAIGPVRYVSFKNWLKQGDRGRFAQMRAKDATDDQIAKTIKSRRN